MRRRKTVDSELIMSLGPCDDWPESRVWRAVPKRIPLTEFLRAEHIPVDDRLWVALHRKILSDRILRLFACDCAERALQRERDAGREPDPRSWNAVAVARRYAAGEATDEELADAWTSAWAASLSTCEAASEAASPNAWAACSAWHAAWEAASYCVPSASERAWQLNHLLAMIEMSEEL
jgi:hypothetical protein